jgi:pentatricopeptide repeat protein
MEAKALVDQMRNKWGAARNAAVYNALLGALVRADRLEESLSTFDAMQSEDGILPTEITFMLLVRACQDNGMVNKARELTAMRDALAETGALENDFRRVLIHHHAGSRTTASAR